MARSSLGFRSLWLRVAWTAGHRLRTLALVSLGATRAGLNRSLRRQPYRPYQPEGQLLLSLGRSRNGRSLDRGTSHRIRPGEQQSGRTTQVYLRASGLTVGESFEDDGDDLSVRVTGSVDGGFRVSVALSAASRCAQLEQQIEALRVAIDLETDINLRKQPISALQRALAEFRALGCVSIVDVGPAVEVASLFAPLHAGRTRGKPEAAEEPEVSSTRDGLTARPRIAANGRGGPETRWRQAWRRRGCRQPLVISVESWHIIPPSRHGTSTPTISRNLPLP